MGVGLVVVGGAGARWGGGRFHFVLVSNNVHIFNPFFFSVHGHPLPDSTPGGGPG